MTVNYSHESSTATFWNFAWLLAKWRGSLWKLVFIEALIWSTLYFTIQCVYYFAIRGTSVENHFSSFVTYARNSESSTLLTMLLGFFTTITITRWWTVYELLVWPDGLATVIATHLNEMKQKTRSDENRKIRRTCARYIMLSYTLLLRDISEPVKRRFPEFESLEGMITSDEISAFNDMIANGHKTCKYAIPLHWMAWTLKKAYLEDNRIKASGFRKKIQPKINNHQYVQLIKEVFKYRSSLADVIGYDWIANPILAYTQACILAVYGYLFQQILSRQVIYSEGHGWNLAFTFIIALAENICYLGWFKAAQVMINPFGFDDEDFEVLWLIDRHWSVVRRVLEEPWKDLPEDVKNNGVKTIERSEDISLPRTLASVGDSLLQRKRLANMQGSMSNLNIRQDDKSERIYLPLDQFMNNDKL